ncbi:MAG: hypothetical protein LRY73_10145 [Bacillus sp. (in: Bacteria)]|nr:hypothetical protein [Bacillus sp. (in: firmicutes)]
MLNIFGYTTSILLLGVLLVIITFTLRLFTEKKSIVIGTNIVVVVIIVGLFYMNQFTNFEKLVSHQLNEDTVIRQITIDVNDPNERYRERVATLTVEEEDTIEQILADLSQLELKRDPDSRVFVRKFHVRILTTNDEDTHLVTRYLALDLDDNYLNEYEIISDTDHLQTIRALWESDEVEWRTFTD